jgi:hypothetical protein
MRSRCVAQADLKLLGSSHPLKAILLSKSPALPPSLADQDSKPLLSAGLREQEQCSCPHGIYVLVRERNSLALRSASKINFGSDKCYKENKIEGRPATLEAEIREDFGCRPGQPRQKVSEIPSQ